MGRISSIMSILFLATTLLAGCGRSLPSPPDPPEMDGAGPDVVAVVESAYKASAMAPGDINARSRLARVYHANTFSDEARTAYEQVIAVIPAHAPTLYWLAMLEQQSGNQDRADILIQQAVDAAPDDLTMGLRQASWAMDAGDHQQVESLLEPLRASNPNNMNLRILDARLAMAFDRPRVAVDILTPMVKSGSPHPYWMHLLGQAHRQLGNEREAYRLRVLGDPVPQQMQDPLIWEVMKERRGFNPGFKRATTLQMQGNGPEAIKLYQDMLAIYPDRSPMLLNAISRAHFAMGNSEQARDALDRAFEFEPENYETNMNYSVLLAKDQPAEALDWARKALAINPAMPAAHAREAKLLFAKDQIEESLAAADEALRLGSVDPSLHLLRGAALVQLNRFQEASEALTIVVGALPLNDRARLLLVVSLVNVGKRDAAIVALEQGLIIKPGHQAFLARLRKLLEPPAASAPEGTLEPGSETAP